MTTQNCFNLKNFLKSLSLLFLLVLSSSTIHAASIPTFYDVPEPANSVSCSCADAPAECANSQNANNCGLPTCDGGNDWTKYRRSSCLKDADDPEAACGAYYKRYDVVYSIGDKCTSGGPYLNPGYCESAFGGPIYKTCCSDTGNALSPYQCVPFDADGAGDPEGRCPAGYQREVRCGDNGVTCGQPACGSVAPAKTCDYNRSYNQCCGNNLSQNVDEYTYSDGTGVCNWVVGACNQADASCANATPPPPTPPPGCTPDGSCTANNPTLTCGVPNPGHDSCNNPCTVAGPACPVDSTPPTCDSFSITDASGNAITTTTRGKSIRVNSSVSDNVMVNITELFTDGVSDGVFNNSLNNNPYTQNLTYDTTVLPVGTHSFTLNAQDSSGNSMFGNNNACHKSIIVDAPATPIVSCSGNPNPTAPGGGSVTWTATASGGSGTYSYHWSGDASGSTQSVSSNYTNTTSTDMPKSATIYVTDSNNINSNTYTCQITVPPPSGTLVVTPSAQPSCPNNETISASWNLISANSYAPDLKSSGGSVGGVNCVTNNSFSFPGTYSITGSYVVYVTAYSGPNCTGSIVANAQSSVSNASCTSTPPPTTPPPATGTCDPAIDSKVSGCVDNVNPGCKLVGGAPTAWCINNIRSSSVCQYCPPPPPPPSCNVITPPNDSPTVTLRPDGRTLDITYQYAVGGGGESEGVSTYRAPDSLLQKIWQRIQKLLGVKDAFGQSSVPEIRGTIFRSTKRGFIQSSGTEVGTQFGSFGISFDDNPPLGDQGQIEYYQVNALSGSSSTPSNTQGVVVRKSNSRSCTSGSYYGILLPSLVSASQVSSTDTQVTFKLVYDWAVPAAFTGNRSNPNYLKIDHSISSTPGYIPWNSSTKVEKTCTAYSGSWPYDCAKERYTVTYVLDLPPATSDSLTITGYNGTGCTDVANIGTTSFTAQTQTGTSPDPISPILSANFAQAANGHAMVAMSWPQTLAGEVVKAAKSNARWAGTSISTNSHGTYANGVWTFKTTDDLSNLPRGQTYYYGIELDLFSLVGTGCNNNQRDVSSEQTPFYWDYGPWVKTIGGDVHSQTGINTPGGP